MLSRIVAHFHPFCPFPRYQIRHPSPLRAASAASTRPGIPPPVLPLLARRPSRMSRSPSVHPALPQIANQGRLSPCFSARFVLVNNANSSICDSLPPLARSAVRMDKHTIPQPDEATTPFLWQPAPFAHVLAVLPRVESNLTRYRYRYLFKTVHIVHNKTPAIIQAGVPFVRRSDDQSSSSGTASVNRFLASAESRLSSGVLGETTTSVASLYPNQFLARKIPDAGLIFPFCM